MHYSLLPRNNKSKKGWGWRRGSVANPLLIVSVSCTGARSVPAGPLLIQHPAHTRESTRDGSSPWDPAPHRRPATTALQIKVSARLSAPLHPVQLPDAALGQQVARRLGPATHVGIMMRF